MWGWGTERGEESIGRDPEQCLHPTPRLAKSTLTLIPLLGTHEVVFAFVMDEHARGTLRFIKLFTELSFTSFQVTARPGSSLAKSQSGSGAGSRQHHADGHPGAWGQSGPCPEFRGWSRARVRISVQHPLVGQEACTEVAVAIPPGVTAAIHWVATRWQTPHQGLFIHCAFILAAPQKCVGSPDFTEEETDARRC